MPMMRLPAKMFSRYLPVTYRKREVLVCPSEHVSLYGLNWDGGSKSTYTALTIDGARAVGSTAKYEQMAPWNNPAAGARLPLPQGFIVVETGYFMGKPAMAKLYVNPADMPRWLSAPVAA